MAEGNFTSELAVALAISHTAPAEDVTLTERDAMAIFEELLEAMNQAYVLGLKMNLPTHEVDAISAAYTNARDRLLQVILVFLRRAEPRPTWRVIVDALRSPAVNLTALAERVEAAHFPDLMATRLPPPATGESVTRQSTMFLLLLSQQDHLLLIAFHLRHHLLILVS